MNFTTSASKPFRNSVHYSFSTINTHGHRAKLVVVYLLANTTWSEHTKNTEFASQYEGTQLFILIMHVTNISKVIQHCLQVLTLSYSVPLKNIMEQEHSTGDNHHIFCTTTQLLGQKKKKKQAVKQQKQRSIKLFNS